LHKLNSVDKNIALYIQGAGIRTSLIDLKMKFLTIRLLDKKNEESYNKKGEAYFIHMQIYLCGLRKVNTPIYNGIV
jgi:hypothetical protein